MTGLCCGSPQCVQADAGAQAVQIFDSWASELAPQDFDVFAGPYIKQIIASVRQVPWSLPGSAFVLCCCCTLHCSPHTQ
jgi:uroporphyrinogen-III decarboxylase